MQPRWHELLTSLGANIVDDHVFDFGDLDNELEHCLTNPVLSPLTRYATLEITGEDRETFLHGQLINDLQLLDPGHCHYSGWCNPKGQVITTLLVVNTPSSYLLIVRLDQKDYLLKRLRMFVLRANVAINDLTESCPLIGMSHIDAGLLSDSIGLPAAGAMHTYKDGFLFTLPDSSGRTLLSAPADTISAMLDNGIDNVEMIGEQAWELQTIQSGIPWIGQANQERFLPQMLNMDQFNAMSYQKGCYPGQEVIARLHYRGEVKKRLQLISSAGLLEEGMLLNSTDGNHVGTIVNSVKHHDGSYHALAVLDNKSLDVPTFPENDAASAINLLEIPYPVNDD